jgi:hypothetical protein
VTLIAFVLGAVWFGLLAALGLLYPRHVQKFLVAYYERHDQQAKLNPFVIFIRSEVYPWFLRAFGAFMLILFVTLAQIVITWMTHPSFK